MEESEDTAATASVSGCVLDVVSYIMAIAYNMFHINKIN